MSAGGVQLLQQGRQVAQALGPGRVLERLVLRKNVDESVAGVVAVAAKQVPPAVAERHQHLPDLGLRTELRHSAWAVAPAPGPGPAAGARPSSAAAGGRATAPALRWARHPGSSAPSTRSRPPGWARRSAWSSDSAAAAT